MSLWCVRRIRAMAWYVEGYSSRVAMWADRVIWRSIPSYSDEWAARRAEAERRHAAVMSAVPPNASFEEAWGDDEFDAEVDALFSDTEPDEATA